jgi:uncharacterized membrane protein
VVHALIVLQENMNFWQHLFRFAIGICALAIPSLGIFVASGYTLSSELIGLIFFSAILAITIGLAGILAWFSVRYGHMSVKAAAILPSIPFAVIVVILLPALFLGFVGSVLLWAIPLVLAFTVARRAGLLAQNQTNQKEAEQVGAGDAEEAV